MNMGRRSWLRQFITLDYLGNPNNYFYRPLNINMEQGIWGFKRSVINGFHRLVARSETVYYSPWKIYGFKFNFFGSLEAAQLSHEKVTSRKIPFTQALAWASASGTRTFR